MIVRTLALQGFWTGLIGAGTGMVAAIVGLFAGPVDDRVGPGGGAVRLPVRPLDLAVILVTGVVAATLAAVVPARTASRVPVMAALAGRRPLGRVPRHLVPIGVGLFAFGVFLLRGVGQGTGVRVGDGDRRRPARAGRDVLLQPARHRRHEPRRGQGGPLVALRRTQPRPDADPQRRDRDGHRRDRGAGGGRIGGGDERRR